MKKLFGVVLAGAIIVSPASPAFADRSDSRRSSSSCTADAGVLTRTVNVKAFCGEEAARQSNRRSSCSIDLGVLRNVAIVQALCGGEGASQKAREDSRRNNRRCSVDLGVLTRAVSAQALCNSR